MVDANRRFVFLLILFYIRSILVHRHPYFPFPPVRLSIYPSIISYSSHGFMTDDNGRFGVFL